MNQNIIYCRNALMNSMSDGRIENGDILIVSSFRPDGCYNTEYIPADIPKIAETIYANEYDKLFCDGNDYALFNTIGRELDAHIGLADSFLKELMETLGVLDKKYLLIYRICVQNCVKPVFSAILNRYTLL